MNLDIQKFKQEIQVFEHTIAPSYKQKMYLQSKKDEIEKELLSTANRSNQSVERVMLVALCGELEKNSSKQKQAEFASRLILLDLLTE